MELTWEQAKEQIDQYIISYFVKIEWYYGDNRAPFAYPAQFYIKQGNTPVYICELVMEYPGAENIIKHPCRKGYFRRPAPPAVPL